jgi:hypothetical protein
MFSIEIESTAGLQDRLEAMQQKIKQFEQVDMPNELFNWEAEDLHRMRPWVRRRRRSAMTIVRPHSVREMKARHRLLVRAHRRHRQVQRWSTRPILRAELWKTLVERMTALLAEKIHW